MTENSYVPALTGGNASPEQRRGLFSTISGVENEPLYTRESVEVDDERDLGFPGEFPFTRGVYPSMYRGRLWTMRQFAGFGTAEETNERFRYLLEHGQTGLSTAFDMPTLMGYDSDHLRSEGEVGREGVAIDSLADMETLFAGIPLGEVSTSMTINSPAAMLLAFYVCVGEEQGVPRAALRGTIQTDILKEYIAQKEYIFPPEPSMRLVTDMVEFCAREMPLWHPISISGYHIREAGSTAAQELAFTLADGFTYVDWALERGLAVDEFAPRLSFFFNAHLDFFEEIAKYRAARRIWARHLRERYGAKDPRSWLMRFHTQTAGVSLTAQQPEVNIVRTAIEALAAVLGGTQSLHTNSFDEALALPTEDAVRLALRTQQVIAHETGVVNTIDPLGGSYYLEQLTNELERQAEEYFERIDALGGVVAAIRENFFQQEIADAAFRYQSEVEAEQRIVVGVNRYRLDDEPPLEILRIDPALEAKQIDRVQ
ncbi:MAG TPA: methylmalonyl-CoA mutase family protein, partial [Fimbriimonadaceae bacterium]|nr:methylmalonyl-CoA mutase family protein [Fimbriimonadaceae bacterium]